MTNQDSPRLAKQRELVAKESDAIAKRRATEHFFNDLEEMIVQRLHHETITDEGREELVRSTGVADPKLVDELVKLGITADGLIALRLFPLVLVAWAEDGADVGERSKVMAEAGQLGIEEGSTAWVLLDTWLRKQPPGLGVDAWKRYTHGIFSRMTVTSIERLIKLTEKQMTSVAKASGGHLGFGKVCKKERIMIDKLLREMRQAAMLPRRSH
tara:strand:- start:124699 stop:125337 length:639 start_codon:yes stop_codon:yes gene_type:complete